MNWVKCHLKSQQTYLFMLQKKNFRLPPSEKLHQAVGDIFIRKQPISLYPRYSVSYIQNLSKKHGAHKYNNSASSTQTIDSATLFCLRIFFSHQNVEVVKTAKRSTIHLLLFLLSKLSYLLIKLTGGLLRRKARKY